MASDSSLMILATERVPTPRGHSLCSDSLHAVFTGYRKAGWCRTQHFLHQFDGALATGGGGCDGFSGGVALARNVVSSRRKRADRIRTPSALDEVLSRRGLRHRVHYSGSHIGTGRAMRLPSRWIGDCCAESDLDDASERN